MIENENTEFKSRFTEEIYREVVAFANTDGGTVYVGINNEGNTVGVADFDREYTRITNGIRDAIAPDVTMCVRVSAGDGNTVQIAVSEGANKPYYIKSKGLKPSGVFVRQGASAVPASPEQIRQMIKRSDGDVFEEMRSPLQELTFDAAESVFGRLGVGFGAEKYRALGMLRDGGIYSNLALLLSDQCLHTTKIAVFDDETNTVFRDSKEFGGSVLRQFEDACSYLALCNRTRSTIKGMVRTDKQDYPEEAIREALLNALVHRDYSFSGSIIINVNDGKMEFISIGGLLPGISKEDIKIGISQPRNRNLAEVFHRLRLIESYGTGIRRIYKLYEDCIRQPVIEVSTNAFKIVLPNRNEVLSAAGNGAAPTEQMRRVLEFLAVNGFATDADLEALLGVKHTRLYNLTREMAANGLLRMEGKGKEKKYLSRE